MARAPLVRYFQNQSTGPLIIADIKRTVGPSPGASGIIHLKEEEFALSYDTQRAVARGFLKEITQEAAANQLPGADLALGDQLGLKINVIDESKSTMRVAQCTHTLGSGSRCPNQVVLGLSQSADTARCALHQN